MVMGELTVETDVAVIGGGPGGYVAALRAAQLGKSVTLIEKERLGGICLNVGCIPSKALIHAADLFDEIKGAEKFGIKVGKPEIDAGKMQEWKQNVVDKLVSGIEQLCKNYGVDVVHGEAFFESADKLIVKGEHGTSGVKFRNAIIATGSRPVEIKGFEFSKKNVVDSTGALSLKEIPKEIVVIGGGYIGLELGTVYAKLGSNVSIIERGPQLIPRADSDVARVVTKRLEQLGVKIYLNAEAKGIIEVDEKNIVKIKTAEKEIEIPADKVLVAVGRKPNSEHIGLDKTQVKVNSKGFIMIDQFCRTSQQNIYAIGDVAGDPMLAHKGFRQGKVAAEVIAGKKSAFDNVVVPEVIFSDPEIASVGLSEREAFDRSIKIKVGKFPLAASGRAMGLGRTEGFMKIISDAEGKQILGVHLVSPNASDMIAEAALAMELGTTVEDLALTIHPHPTLSEAIAEAAEDLLGKIVHLYKPAKKA